MTIAYMVEAINTVWGRPQNSRETLGIQQQVAFGSPGCHIPGSDGQNGSGDGGAGHQEACCYGRQQEACQINSSHTYNVTSKRLAVTLKGTLSACLR